MNAGGLAGISLPNKGSIIDTAYAEYSAWATLNTAIPYDDTVPQITEGVGVLAVSIATKTPRNKLRIEVNVPICPNQSSNMIVALFLNGAADAIAATVVTTNALNHTACAVILFEYFPKSTLVQNLTVRAGPAPGATAYVNGNNASRLLGGVARASIKVEEIVQ